MPNKPRPENPGRVVRVDDALWAKVQTRAEDEGVKPSAIVRAALRAYLEEGLR